DGHCNRLRRSARSSCPPDEQFMLSPAPGGLEGATVDDGRCQITMAEDGTGARPPCGTGVVAELGCRLFPQMFEDVAPLDQGDALGDETFEFDRTDFRAVLIASAFG